MKRVTLVFPILTLILILSLFGCGGAESTPTVAPTATAVPKSVQTPSLPLLEAITSALEAQDEEEYQASRSAIADHLLAGTDPNLEFTEVSGDDGEEGGLYPLHLVISTCYFNEISVAFEEIYLPEDHADRCTDLADLLIEGGADVDLPSESVLGSSPLHLAATHGQLDLAELLIDSGASVNQLDQGGSTPLDSTAMARLTIASFALWGMDDVINESAVDAIADLLTEHGGISENPIPGESLALIEDNFDSDSDGMTLEGLLEGLEGIFEDAIDAEEDPGSDNIWVMNADGSGQTRLTESGGFDKEPSWSPDGTQIVFASDRESDSMITDIYVMNADGSGQTRLTESGGSDYQPSWSPDGTQLIFASDRESDSYIDDIWVMDADGSNQTRLTESGGYDYQPSWSPDGTQIVFASDRESDFYIDDIYVMNADGSGQTRLTESGGYMPSWSPDGTQLVFVSDRESDSYITDIYVMDADGSRQTRLTESGGADYQPSWSPDGTQIVFASDRESGFYIDDIYVMNADGSGQTRLTESGGYDYQPSWSPDGTQIVFVSDRSSTAATNLTPTPSKASAVFGNTLGDSVVNSDEILGMMPEYDDATLPVALVVVFDDGVDGKIWGDGRYTRCVTGEPCGHLSSPTIHGREVYVKTSGHAASDPSHHWHYAYIFLKQTGSQTWPIQYVVPSSQWMAHRYFDSDNPWGDWGDLVVTADYD